MNVPRMTNKDGALRMRQLLAAAALSLVVLVVGCDDDGGPSSDPTETLATPAPPTSQSPTVPAAPDVPLDAQQKTKAGAVAFVKHWVDVLNEADESGDPTKLDLLSGPKCRFCNQDIASIRKTHDEGGRVVTKGWRVLSSVPIGKWSPSPVMSTLVRIEKSTVIHADGRKEHFPARTQVMEFHLDYGDAGWIVTNYEWIST